MHVSIHQLIKGYVENQHSSEIYLQVLNEAGIEKEEFEAENYHNDAKTEDVLSAAIKILSTNREEFLTNAGLDAAPGLLDAFKAFCDPDWDVLDLLEHVEPRMHRHVREEMGAFPPALKPERKNKNELEINIRSHRRMAFLAKGFILGFAKEYGDEVEVTVDETDTQYTILVKKTTKIS
ncbi:hypothetical protein A9Q86_09855 [Flavobacteriales bacterium 33_180_T64]|nr:hypothetical protein A9Q86_09855 [Flavobacteriales bacterium 33_180_T64]